MVHFSTGLDNALVWQWPSSSRWNEDLAFENLAALWPNYRSHGATHLVLARVLESRDELDRYRNAIPGAELTAVRLTASEELRRERLRARMPAGESRDWHLRRTAELDAVLDARRVEDFSVDNGHRPVRDVALEIINRAGWVSHEQASSLQR